MTTKWRPKKNNISKLPYQILVEIFLKLPVSALFQCMRVCKSWPYIPLNDSDFARLFLPKSTSNLLIFSHTCRNCGLLDLDESDIEKQFLDFSSQNWLPRDICCMWGSSNGLVLFSDWNRLKFYLCNPLRREYVCLLNVKDEDPAILASIALRSGLVPRGSEIFRCGIPMAAIGFCPKTNQYKVIRIVQLRLMDVAKCEIHTLGTHSWRNIGDVPYPSSTIIFVNGSFHWMNPTGVSICSLKIDEEKIESIPVPPSTYRYSLKRLGVLDNCLILLADLYKESEIWVMKNYGDAESWTQDWNIKVSNRWRRQFRPSTIQPIKIMDERELVVSYGKYKVSSFCNQEFAFYNRENGIMKKWKTHGKTRCFLQPGYTCSFISPKDVIMGENSDI